MQPVTEGKKVRLKIVSRMRDPQGDVFETKNARRGLLCETDAGLVLDYDDEQENERAHVKLTMESGAVTMLRTGMMSGRLMFVPGRRMAGSYVSIYGEIPVAVDTRRAQWTRDENGGRLLLDYDVYMGGDKTSSAMLEATWRL